MFGRAKDEPKSTTPSAQAAGPKTAPAPAEPMATPPEPVRPRPTATSTTPSASQTINSIIGKGSTFSGDVHVTGAVRVDGDVEGTVHATERVQVGNEGFVNGGVSGNEIVISGRLEGTIKADARVHLVAGARVQGDIHCRRLVIEDGAIFDGSTTMDGMSSTNSGSTTVEKKKLEVVKS
jgi:cytoskeletal protein CcmA (bactofilin family)